MVVTPDVPPPAGGCLNACPMYDQCARTSPDTRPYRCDYLVDGTSGFKATHVIMLVGAALLGAGSFVKQLDDSDVEMATFKAREFIINNERPRMKCFIKTCYELYSCSTTLCCRP